MGQVPAAAILLKFVFLVVSHSSCRAHIKNGQPDARGFINRRKILKTLPITGPTSTKGEIVSGGHAVAGNPRTRAI